MKLTAWVWFAIAQIVMLALTVLGWVALIVPCLLEAWELSPDPSIKDGRKIDRWGGGWRLLDFIYGNPEDGVSGQTAIVWGSGADAGKLVSFMPGVWAPWRAYCWSAWRNSTNQLKYALAVAWFGSPHFTVKILGRTLSGGWSIENNLAVLVLSFK